MISVIIPSRNERFLPQTVRDLLKNGTDIEIITVLDGYWEHDLPYDDKRLKVIHRGKAMGMRDAINSAAAIAQGEYLMKCDAHCMFGEGFDSILAADCADNWVVIPRRYSLDAEKWERAPKEPIDSMHYFWPYAHPDDLGLHGRPWMQRGRKRKDVLIDEDVTFQGSCWFMHRDHFKRIGGLSEVGYETFMGEPQEIGFKTQLGQWEGKVIRNKKTWYAHLHKGKTYGRMYSFSQSERVRGNAHSFDFWWRNRWTERKHDLEWLIEKFWPHPGWPENWREYVD
jgi:glycosyltransferase involved in cell wall biosynthesis